jgi:hypothetical protein
MDVSLSGECEVGVCGNNARDVSRIRNIWIKEEMELYF